MQNVDAKILAKVLVSRLEIILPKIISEEQTGFIKGRQFFFNVRTLLNVIYSKHSSKTPEVVISFDAEKAFDRGEGGYMFAELKNLGLGIISLNGYIFYMIPLRQVCIPIILGLAIFYWDGAQGRGAHFSLFFLPWS